MTWWMTDSGEAPGRTGTAPLLLVHGWGSDGEDWAPHLPALTARHRVLVPDLPGHGRTPAAGFELSPLAVAHRLAAELHRSRTGPVVAVGHSMGGQVVTALAVEHPELVRSVVTIATAYGGDPARAGRLPGEQEALRREGVAWALRFVRGAFTEATPAQVRARHERLMAAMDPAVLLAYREAMYIAPGAFGLRPAAEGYLARRRCPALGLHTGRAAVRWEETTFNHPLSRAVLWEGTGHYPHEERPAELVELLIGWCARTGAGGPQG